MTKKVIQSAQAPTPIGPYSQAIKAGNLLFLSGQVAIDPATSKVVNNSVAEETEQVLKNLSEVLKTANMNFSNVVKCTIFLKNMDDFSVVNEIYGKYFSTQPPARETVEVSRLPKDVNVEISCIAVE